MGRKDTVRILLHMIRHRQITMKRIFNTIRNCYAFYIKKDIAPKGYPIILMIEPTNICNLKCPLCPTGAGTLTRNKGFMSFDNFKKVVDEIGDYLFNITLYNFGEPFMNKDIYKMIEYAKNKRSFVRVSTNGHFFKEEDVERLVKSELDDLIVSIDGASQDTYVQYRKSGDFNLVIDNLKRIVKMKRELKSKLPYIEVQFIVMKHNEHEVGKIEELAKEIGVDKLTLKGVIVGEVDNLSDEEKAQYIPDNPEFRRYSDTKNWINKEKVDIHYCTRVWLSTMIMTDGSVVPCCYDYNATYTFGNAFKEKFMDIWNNKKYQNFRRQIIEDKREFGMCKNCTGKLLNTALD